MIQQFLYDLDQDFGREVQLEDMIGISFEFSVWFNKSRPNFETLFRIDNYDTNDEESSYDENLEDFNYGQDEE